MIKLNNLEVPTRLSPNSIIVAPNQETSAVKSGFIGTRPSYVTGESVQVTITARDQFSNLRFSTDDTFNMYLTGQSSNTQYGPITATPIAGQPGNYTASFLIEKVEAYTIQVKLGTSAHIAGSPVTNVNVFASDVQAKYSELFYKQPVIVAGVSQVWKIEARDYFQNVVVGTEDLFGLEIEDT